MHKKRHYQITRSAKRMLGRFGVDKSGATAIEYALIVALLGLVLTAALRSLDQTIYNLFNSVVGKF